MHINLIVPDLYCVPGPWFRAPHVFFPLTPLNNSMRNMLIPIFQIRKVRPREAQSFVQDLTAS